MNKYKRITEQERQEVYKDPKWKKITYNVRMKEPLCQCCMKLFDRTRLAQHTHHINSPFQYLYHSKEWYEYAYDYNNTASLCIECHDKIHNKEIDIIKTDDSIDFVKTNKFIEPIDFSKYDIE